MNSATDLIVLTGNPSLEWDSAGAAQYNVKISRVSDGAQACLRTTTELSILLAGCGLDPGVTYAIDVTAINQAGRSLPARFAHLFIIDVLAPTLTIVSSPPTVSNAANGSFFFVSSDPESGIERSECRIDSGAFTVCSSPFVFSGLADGPHQVAFRSYDRAARVSPTVTYSWTVDSTSMGAFGILGVLGNTDSSPDICLTAGAVPSLQWQSSANANSYLVSILDNTGSAVVCPELEVTGTTHSFTGCPLLSGSTYRARVLAKRSTGATSPASNNDFSFRVDSSPSAVTSAVSASSPHIANGTDASSLLVTIRNQDGCPIEGVTPTVSSSGSNNAVGACTLTNSTGTSSCTLTSTRAEAKVVSISTPVATGSAAVTFLPGPAAALAFNQAPSSAGIAGSPLSQQPVVELVDAYNNRVTSGSHPITLSAFHSSDCSTSPGAGTFSPSSSSPSSLGLASFSGTAYTLATTTLYIRASTSTGGVTSACAGPITIQHGVATNLTFSVAPSETKTGLAMNPSPEVRVWDAYGNQVLTGPDATAQFALSLFSGTGVLSGTTVVFASSGAATFGANLSISQPGTKVLRATKSDTSGTGGGTTSITVDSASFEVVPVTCNSGSLATTCIINANQTIPDGVTITGNNLLIQSGTLSSETAAQSITINLTGTLTVQNTARLRGNFDISAGAVEVQTGGGIDAIGLGYLGGRQTGNVSDSGLGSGGGAYNFNGTYGSGSGGGYGGAGGTNKYGGLGGVAYGVPADPTDFGSGGGAGLASRPGGNGGGRVRITSVGATTINGFVDASGASGSCGTASGCGGGGSGGAIKITAASINGTGTLTANGAWGGNSPPNTSSGGGAGGRIALLVSNPFGGSMSVWGGPSGNGSTVGAKGTIYQSFASLNQICDSGDLSSTCIVSTRKFIPNGTIILGTGNLQINSTGDLHNANHLETFGIQMTGNVVLQSSAQIIGNLDSLQAANLILGANARINASAVGYPGSPSALGSGPGGGVQATSGGMNAGSGGSYGGAGKSSNTGAVASSTYGSASNPSDFGSGGGDGLFYNTYSIGGAGGGLIRIVVSGNIEMGAGSSITADGANGGGSSAATGAGSGGSIYISAASIDNSLANLDDSHLISAVGGNGSISASTASFSGAGGGGRIHLNVDRAPSAMVDVRGGIGFQGSAGSGTYTWSLSDPNRICDTGDLNTTCTINRRKWLPDGYNLSGTGAVILQNRGMIFNTIPTTSISANIGSITLQNGSRIHANLNPLQAASVTIDAGAEIRATGLGFVGGHARGLTNTTVKDGDGPGGGVQSGPFVRGPTTLAAAGGGGHAGSGGSGNAAGSTGGASYGSPADPVTFGSGGGMGVFNGYGLGGTGGGLIRIIASGALVLGGTIAADGFAGFPGTSSGGSGGGAGGAVNLNVGSISGSGFIYARGGNGGTESIYGSAGGGGSGGYVRIQRGGGSAFAGTVGVSGGTAAAGATVGASGIYTP